MRSPKQRLIVGRLIQYVKDLISTGHSEGAKNILLSGNLGTGKTLYASILLQAVLNRALSDGVQDERDIRLKGRLSVQFVSEPNLLNQLTAIWKSNTDTQKAMIARLAEKAFW
jgi:DNA replication protein DnaC